MIKFNRHDLTILFLTATLLISSGCVGGSTRPSKFYLLEALPQAESSPAGQSGVSVMVGPVMLPGYLDRAQLATRAGGNVLVVDEFHRWAEPLGDNFSQVLAENLSVILDTVYVYVYPQRRDVAVDYQIEITLFRFDASSDGKVALVAYWSVIGKDIRKALSRKKSDIRVAVQTQGYDAIVAAQNRALESFSREIAAEITRLK